MARLSTHTAVLALCFALAGCLKEDPPVPADTYQKAGTGVLKVTVRPMWDGAPFDRTDVHLSPGDERILVQQVKFYLSRLTVVGPRGADEISAVELLDITNGPRVRTYVLDTGAVDSLRFGLGLPPELNTTDITTVDPMAPLGNNSGMYWTWATMYRFLIFDGRFDTDAGGVGTPPFPFSIHTGRDTCFRHAVLATPLTVRQADTAEIELRVDIRRFFTDGTSVLRMSDGSQSHGELPELGQALKLSDLAVRAIQPP